MGCTSSKNEEVIQADFSKSQITKKEEKKEESDDDLQVIDPGKKQSVNKLDEITDKKLNTINNKKSEDVNESKVTLNVPQNIGLVRGDSYNGIEASNQGLLPSNNDYKKAKTFAEIPHENHPHEFDFSFVNEKNSEEIEKDQITDNLLKEISSTN